MNMCFPHPFLDVDVSKNRDNYPKMDGLKWKTLWRNGWFGGYPTHCFWKLPFDDGKSSRNLISICCFVFRQLHHVSGGHATQRLKCFRNGLSPSFRRSVTTCFGDVQKIGAYKDLSLECSDCNLCFKNMWHWNPFQKPYVLGTWIDSKLFETLAMCHKLVCDFQQNSSIVLAASSFDDAN